MIGLLQEKRSLKSDEAGLASRLSQYIVDKECASSSSSDNDIELVIRNRNVLYHTLRQKLQIRHSNSRTEILHTLYTNNITLIRYFAVAILSAAVAFIGAEIAMTAADNGKSQDVILGLLLSLLGVTATVLDALLLSKPIDELRDEPWSYIEAGQQSVVCTVKNPISYYVYGAAILLLPVVFLILRDIDLGHDIPIMTLIYQNPTLILISYGLVLFVIGGFLSVILSQGLSETKGRIVSILIGFYPHIIVGVMATFFGVAAIVMESPDRTPFQHFPVPLFLTILAYLGILSIGWWLMRQDTIEELSLRNVAVSPPTINRVNLIHLTLLTLWGLIVAMTVISLFVFGHTFLLISRIPRSLLDNTSFILDPMSLFILNIFPCAALLLLNIMAAMKEKAHVNTLLSGRSLSEYKSEKAGRLTAMIEYLHRTYGIDVHTIINSKIGLDRPALAFTRGILQPHNYLIISELFFNHYDIDDIAVAIAHEFYHLKEDTFLLSRLRFLSTITMAGRSLLAGIINFSEREYLADSFAAEVMGVEQVVRTMSKLKALDSQENSMLINPGFLGLNLKRSSGRSNPFILAYSLFFTAYIPAYRHPSIDDRLQHVKERFGLASS